MRTSLVTACAPSLVPNVHVPVWLWASMMPGVMCLPARSIVRAPLGIRAASSPSVTMLMRPSSIMSEPFSITPAGPQVQMVAWVKSTVSCAGASAIA